MEDPGLGKVERQTMVLPGRGFKYRIRTKNCFTAWTFQTTQPVQTFLLVLDWYFAGKYLAS